jgi:hypothetical protein
MLSGIYVYFTSEETYPSRLKSKLINWIIIEIKYYNMFSKIYKVVKTSM